MDATPPGAVGGTVGDTLGGLEQKVWRGLAWSFLNTIAGRLGSLLAGIVIARIVDPEAFGVYAVALVALNLLLSMNELGVSVALVRHPGPVTSIAPTVATLSIGSSAVLFAAMFLAAGPFAAAMGAPEATGIIQLMSVAVLIDGVTSVPVAMLTRAFMQAKRMQIDLIGFAVSTPVTILLALAGHGAWSLAWGAVAGNLATGLFSVLWSPERYLPGFDKSVVGPLLRFGLPLAGASLLLLALVNADFVVAGRVLGTAQLGLYFLGFNLSTWPMTLVSTVVRRVTTAAYAQLNDRGDGHSGFRQSLFLVLSLGMLLSVLLAAYAEDIVRFLYGERWVASAVVIPALVILSMGRMVVELSYDYLVALGRTVGNAWLHGVWLVALVPALVIGASGYGIGGLAWAHAVVVIVLVLPGIGILLKRAGTPVWPLVADLALPVLGASAVFGSSVLLRSVLPDGFLLLAVGGVCGTAVYALCVGRKVLRTIRAFMAAGARSR
jgi:O-antigen/teichoic acid export membrane protein